MSDQELDAKQIEKKVHDLAEAMDRVKTAQADRDDVVVDMKQAARARLELLARDLQPVFDDIPADSDQFEFALANGEPPRLWIDATSFVRMGPDRRMYEFVKDTRLGRTILGQSEDKSRMGAMVTEYVAERVLERKQMIEGEWVAMRGYSFDATDPESTGSSKTGSNSGHGWKFFLWFLLGLIGGAAAMIGWAWFGFSPAL